MSEIIKFYKTNDPYGCFSNFSKHPVLAFGLEWPTTEHLYQSAKFDDPVIAEQIRTAPGPRKAAEIGRTPHPSYDPNWDNRKDLVMLVCLAVKVMQHPDVAQILLSTGDSLIVEDTVNDNYWASGPDGNGQNKLGKCWMVIRSMLRYSSHSLEDIVSEFEKSA